MNQNINQILTALEPMSAEDVGDVRRGLQDRLGFGEPPAAGTREPRTPAPAAPAGRAQKEIPR